MNNYSLRMPKICHATRTISVTETFNRAAAHYGTDAFNILMEIRRTCPGYQVVCVAKKKSAKKGAKITYAMMGTYIKHLRNGKELLEIFEQVKDYAKSQHHPYKRVCEWFNESFPNYNSTPRFDREGFLVAETNIVSFEDYKEKQEAAKQQEQSENEQQAAS